MSRDQPYDDVEIDMLACTWLDERTFSMTVRERRPRGSWFWRVKSTERTAIYLFRLGVRQWLDDKNEWVSPRDPRHGRLTELLSAWWTLRGLDRAIGIEPPGPMS